MLGQALYVDRVYIAILLCLCEAWIHLALPANDVYAVCTNSLLEYYGTQREISFPHHCCAYIPALNIREDNREMRKRLLAQMVHAILIW